MDSPRPLKRRRVRKGTRSCWECRRRKAKCSFSSTATSGDAICDGCQKRGSSCIDQRFVEDEDDVDRSVGRDTVPDPGATQTRPAFPRSEVFDPANASSDREARRFIRGVDHSLDPITTERLGRTPGRIHRHIGSVWDLRQNEARSVPQRNELPSPPQSIQSSDSRIQPRPHSHGSTTQALLQAVSHPKDIEIIFEHVPVQSLLCFQSNYKSSCSGALQLGIPREHASLTDLLSMQTHPILLARHMLELAIALRHFDRNTHIPGLSEHHHVVMERMADAAIRHVTTNDTLLGSLEGLETIILEAFYHVDSGNIRRAWMTMRRGIMVGQLLGLHRPGHYRYKRINDEADLDPEIIWSCIINIESCLSMLLGLPTSTGAAETQLQGFDLKTCSNISPLLMRTTARILQRNEIPSCLEALELTKEIDHEILQMSQQLPSTFWHPPALAGLAIDSEAAFFETRRAWDLMCYHTLINQLHLPYMLFTHPAQIVYSRMACVNASREILNSANALRAFNPRIVCCRMGDFMGLIAGMSLMLAHLVSHCHKEMHSLLAHQRAGDRAIVERALECMKSMSEVGGDVLAVRCASLLNHLLAIEADAARAQSSRVQQFSMSNETNDGGDDAHNVLVVDVPYVGTIRISRDGIMSKAPPSKPHGGDLQQESVTIGGIGSLQVSATNTPGTGLEQTAHVGCQSMHGALPDPDEALPELDTAFMFPDAAAGMDDWVLQGTDTAFFDVLMRSLDGQLGGVNNPAESWDATV